MFKKLAEPALRVVEGGAAPEFLSHAFADDLELRLNGPGVPPGFRDEVKPLVAKYRRKPFRWVFWQVNLPREYEIFEYLEKHARQPFMAVKLFKFIQMNMGRGNNLVVIPRGEIVERFRYNGHRVTASDVSRVLSLLVKAGALRHEGQDERRRKVFALDPNCITQMRGPERLQLQLQFAAGVSVVEGDASPDDDKPGSAG